MEENKSKKNTRAEGVDMTKQESYSWNTRILTEIKSEIMDSLDYLKTNESEHSKTQRKLRAFEEIVDILGMKGTKGEDAC